VYSLNKEKVRRVAFLLLGVDGVLGAILCKVHETWAYSLFSIGHKGCPIKKKQLIINLKKILIVFESLILAHQLS
jgi:hypothetical protein